MTLGSKRLHASARRPRRIAAGRALLASSIAVCALGVGACGGAGKHATASNAAATKAAVKPEYATIDKDRDNDIQALGDDTQHPEIVNFGRAADEPDRRAIAALIKSYYSAALAEDGAKGCSLIYSPMAEATPEDYGLSNPPGPPYMKGKTCKTILAGLYRHIHARLAAQVPKLEVTRVRLREHSGMVLLGFGPAWAQRRITVIKEGDTWKMSALIDQELP